ncbi:hypothetical protein Syun_016330 [Stephania yunnanensis]|uniref:Heparan-alpha-glucosaminide N-acetyltransferase catalytic domain-containing protein n=1 Tax=Stephania yunnanensis TaxID=152371 RepID=A0AAP0J717_9MAGN
MADIRRVEEGLENIKGVIEVDERFHRRQEEEEEEEKSKVVHEENNSCTRELIGKDKEEFTRVDNQQPLMVEIKQKSKRIATLDAFRGLTIVLMILVDDAGAAYERIDHSPWNGCTLADFVMPFFLFIVGVAIALAFKRIPKVGKAVKKIILRTLKLLLWGIILQGGYSHAPDDLSYGVDMKHVRWCGILQRIALVYMVVALIETVVTTKTRPTVLGPGYFSIFSAYRWQWAGGFIAFVIYMVTTYSLYVPDWSFTALIDDHHTERLTVKCGVRGHLGPACNAVGYVDRQVWGINHLYLYPVWIRSKDCTLSSPNVGPLRNDAPNWCRAPFEPEGLLRLEILNELKVVVNLIEGTAILTTSVGAELVSVVINSTISAILSGTIGIHYGHVLLHFKGHRERLKHWVPIGLVLFIVAVILHFTDAIPINKQLYSFSYVCFTAGAAGLVFSGFYILARYRRKQIAQGIFAAFVNGWYYETPGNTLVRWIQKHVFNDVWKSDRVGTLLYVMFAEITFWGVVAGILHKLGIYWKL